jgi:chemosensory pili system protein ChpA (sensor histidine kinase/response regulator)
MRRDWPWALIARVAPRWAAGHRAARRDVLVVDDNRDMVDVISAVLDGDGYPCRVALNGQHALEQIAEAMPALVLLDMQMPVMNGWECARRLRADHGHDLPIVVVTSIKHAVHWADQVDADGVLGKPFSIDQLIRVVARYVRPAR